MVELFAAAGVLLVGSMMVILRRSEDTWELLLTRREIITMGSGPDKVVGDDCMGVKSGGGGGGVVAGGGGDGGIMIGGGGTVVNAVHMCDGVGLSRGVCGIVGLSNVRPVYKRKVHS